MCSSVCLMCSDVLFVAPSRRHNDARFLGADLWAHGPGIGARAVRRRSVVMWSWAHISARKMPGRFSASILKIPRFLFTKWTQITHDLNENHFWRTGGRPRPIWCVFLKRENFWKSPFWAFNWPPVRLKRCALSLAPYRLFESLAHIFQEDYEQNRTLNENKLTAGAILSLLQLIFKHLIIDERRFFWKNNSVLILMQLYLTNKRIFSIKGIIKLETKPKKIL